MPITELRPDSISGDPREFARQEKKAHEFAKYLETADKTIEVSGVHNFAEARPEWIRVALTHIPATVDRENEAMAVDVNLGTGQVFRWLIADGEREATYSTEMSIQRLFEPILNPTHYNRVNLLTLLFAGQKVLGKTDATSCSQLAKFLKNRKGIGYREFFGFGGEFSVLTDYAKFGNSVDGYNDGLYSVEQGDALGIWEANDQADWSRWTLFGKPDGFSFPFEIKTLSDDVQQIRIEKRSPIEEISFLASHDGSSFVDDFSATRAPKGVANFDREKVRLFSFPKDVMDGVHKHFPSSLPGFKISK